MSCDLLCKDICPLTKNGRVGYAITGTLRSRAVEGAKYIEARVSILFENRQLVDPKLTLVSEDGIDVGNTAACEGMIKAYRFALANRGGSSYFAKCPLTGKTLYCAGGSGGQG